MLHSPNDSCDIYSPVKRFNGSIVPSICDTVKISAVKKWRTGIRRVQHLSTVTSENCEAHCLQSANVVDFSDGEEWFFFRANLSTSNCNEVSCGRWIPLNLAIWRHVWMHKMPQWIFVYESKFVEARYPINVITSKPNVYWYSANAPQVSRRFGGIDSNSIMRMKNALFIIWNKRG